jgi:hypothetical protein
MIQRGFVASMNERKSSLTTTGEPNMSKSEKTGKRVGTNASSVLRDKGASKAAKSVAGSALAQAKANKQTSAKVARTAAKLLDDGRSSKTNKSIAGSVLTQKVKR